MGKISSAGLRAPASFEGLNVNFCKNPKCANFGVPETPFRTRLPKDAAPEPGHYGRVATGKGKPALKCLLCNEVLPMRSNRAVYEELCRLTAYLLPADEPSCPTEGCLSFQVPRSAAGEAYAQFGKTAAGTPRFRCRHCRKTFSGAGKSTKKQYMAHKNREVFSLLINKMPLRRMAEVTGLDRQTIYGKLAFLHRQCLRFSGDRERRLLEGMPLPKLYLATDRQSLTVNWSNRKDRRNIMLQAIATADLRSGYVFGMDLNFDPSFDLDDVEVEAAKVGDTAKPQPYRQFARFWLRGDYDSAVEESAERRKAKRALPGTYQPDALTAAIEEGYANAAFRDDVEEVVLKERGESLPLTGVELRDQYTIYGHFLMLARLIGHAPKIRCYMDQDSGFRAAFMASFSEQIKERRADGWYVKVLKETTIDEKDAAVAKAKKRFASVKAANAGMDDHQIQVLMALEEMKRMESAGKWNDRWLVHPWPTKAEPDKRLCWLTNIDKAEDDPEKLADQEKHFARLYLKGSLHAVDRFFMQVRRRLSLAERGYATASSDRRMWHGYSAYQPKNLAMVITIFKVAYNYCLPDKKGITPAMRLGLAKGPVALEDIIYF